MIEDINQENQQNNFTLLKHEEILDFVTQSLDQTLELKDLHNPTVEKVYSLFTKILESAEVVKTSQLENLSFKAYESLSSSDYQKVYNPTISLLKLYKFTKKFLSENFSIIDFTCQDIFTPDAKRTRRFLSALIFYLKGKNAHKNMIDKAHSEIISEETKLVENKRALTKLKEEVKTLVYNKFL